MNRPRLSGKLFPYPRRGNRRKCLGFWDGLRSCHAFCQQSVFCCCLFFFGLKYATNLPFTTTYLSIRQTFLSPSWSFGVQLSNQNSWNFKKKSNRENFWNLQVWGHYFVANSMLYSVNIFFINSVSNFKVISKTNFKRNFAGWYPQFYQ